MNWSVFLITVGSISRSLTRMCKKQILIKLRSYFALLKPNTGKTLQQRSKTREDQTFDSICTFKNWIEQCSEFHFDSCQIFALWRQTFKSSNKWGNELMKIRVAEESWFFNKISEIGFWCRDMFFSPRCCLCIIGGPIRDLSWLKKEYCQVFEDFLMKCKLDTKGLQLVKESSSGSIHIPRTDILNSFTAFR